jgi:hypothetical protein
LLTIDLKESCKVRVRIPEFADPNQIVIKSNGDDVKAVVSGNYLELGARQAGEKLVVSYPVPEREEEATIGNPGFRQYRYRFTCKGDTVVRVALLREATPTGYSDFDRKQVRVFYGTEGPGPLYQRDYMREQIDPKPAALHMDDGSLDFWR